MATLSLGVGQGCLDMSQTEWLPLVMYSSWRSCQWGKFGSDVSLVHRNRMTSTGYLQRRGFCSSNPWEFIFRGASQTLAMAISCLYHLLAWCYGGCVYQIKRVIIFPFRSRENWKNQGFPFLFTLESSKGHTKLLRGCASCLMSSMT